MYRSKNPIKFSGKRDEIFFYILIRGYKSYKYFDNCINSIIGQSYDNYKIIFIDDHSGYGKNQNKHVRLKLKNHIIVFNNERKYALKNAYNAIHKFCNNPNAIVINLDADDWLPNPNCLSKIAKVYQKHPNAKITYGDCFIWDGTELKTRSEVNSFSNLNQNYPKLIWETKEFRNYPFLPLHPRTWRVSLFKSIPKQEFLDSSGKWLRFAEDMAIFFPMFEMLKPAEIAIISKPIYVYNQSNPRADITANTIPLLRDELVIRRKNKKLKILNNANYRSLYYHRIMSVPKLGSILYKLQDCALTGKITNNIFISNRVNRNKDWIFKNLNQKQNLIIKTSKAFEIIKDIDNFKILDLPEVDLNKASTAQLYDLMWTLVFCDAVTSPTKTSLAKIIPSNYPVVKL